MAEPMKEVAFGNSEPEEKAPSPTVAAGIGAAIAGAAGAVIGRATGAPVGASALMGAAVGALAGAALAADAAKHLEVSQITSYLKEHLGQDMTAYLGGLDEQETVNRWISGDVRPDAVTGERLRSAFEATRYIVSRYDGETAQAWFLGMNPRLGDESPARTLRTGQRPEDWRLVVPTAKEFLGI